MNRRKGVILAGGSGTRLHPIPRGVEAAAAGLRQAHDLLSPQRPDAGGGEEIAVITTPHDQEAFRRLLGDGSWLGLSLEWIEQPEPGGWPAQAYLLAERFLDGSLSVMVLGDNLFFGHGLPDLLAAADAEAAAATVFGYRMADPERYGVVSFDEAGRVVSIEEKPARPKSSYAVTGLYFFDERASELARGLTPSERGELEITDLIGRYLADGSLAVRLMGRGFAWLDTGTHGSLLDAGDFVRTIEERQDLKIGSPEEIAFRRGFISREALRELVAPLLKTGYGRYLARLAEEDPREAAFERALEDGSAREGRA